MEDNRRYDRIDIQGLEADISDGVGFFPAVISNISRFGIQMTDLPKRVNEQSKKITVVVSGHGRNFKMITRPKWSEKTGLRKALGLEIINTPWEWTDFVMKFEPKDNKDVWETINL